MTGRYRLAESIGQGGMGRVWRATDDVLDRQVAVKEMRIDGLDPENTRTRRERTLREARATARIDHPNVVRVYDVVDEGERLWIVMELVAGRSLEQVVAEDGPLDPPTAARVGLGLVSALRQVHAGGVLHRDIKPGNVLIERRGQRVVLTDFGIAALQDAEALTMVGMLVGSPDYMAPERISGQPQGPPSDVWSLGATLCAALGGRSPFSRSTTLATLHAVLYEEPELPSVASGLRDVLAALLEKEPSTRPGLEELETALWPIAYPGSGPGPGPEPGPEPRAGTGTGTRPEPERMSEPEPEPEPEPSEGTRAAESAPAVRPVHEETPTRVLLDPQLLREARRRPPRHEPDQGPDGTGTTAPVPTGTPPSRTPTSVSAVPDADPDPVREPEPEPELEPEPEPELELESEPDPEPDPVQDAVPPRYTPTRTYPSDPRDPLAGKPGPSEPPAPARPATATASSPASAPVFNASTEVPTELHARVRSEIPSASPPTPAAPVTPSADGRGRRRSVWVAAGGVAVAGAVVGIVLATTGGASHDTGDAPASSGSATAARTPSGAVSSPAPTVDGTSRPPSLPAGAREEAGLYAWVPPRAWQRVAESGSEVHYTSPDSAQEIVANAKPAEGDLLAQWQRAEVDTAKGLDYERTRLERTTFRGDPAVAWEYTVRAKGRLWHVRLLGFRSGGTSYEISTWYHPDIEPSALRVYDRVRESFTPL
ncbi:protein kinase [Streptomyces sp. NPDC056785]|uniref:serine/threonine-protein kinase n=1 Tax=Streptomyces sp. NPDC056785 TaxID=3345944 RepID=UPI0036902786